MPATWSSFPRTSSIGTARKRIAGLRTLRWKSPAKRRKTSGRSLSPTRNITRSDATFSEKDAAADLRPKGWTSFWGADFYTRIFIFSEHSFSSNSETRQRGRDRDRVFAAGRVFFYVLHRRREIGENKIYERADIQSVGAAIQNILLEATSLGIGSLWICDIYFAYDKLSKYHKEYGELLAAVALGYPDEHPAKRPRNAFKDVVFYLK